MLISETTITGLRHLHNQAMMDECDYYNWTPGGTDIYNMPEPDNYTYQTALPCSYKPVRPDQMAPNTDLGMIEGLLAFDRSVEITYDITIRHLDRFRLTKLHGDTLTQPIWFEPDGELKRDNLAIVIPVKKLEDKKSGSDL